MKKAVKTITTIFLILVAWQILSMYTLPIFIPSPKSVIETFVTMLINGSLFQAIKFSMLRITIAITLSSALAIICALLMQINKIFKSILYPLVKLLRYLPSTAFAPLLLMWLGIGEKMKIAFLSFVSFVYMMPSVYMTFEDSPKEIIDAGRALGIKDSQIIMKILFPYHLPSICKQFALMYGIGWTYIAVAEETNAIAGLGYMVNNASARGRTNVVFVAIVTIVIISILFDCISDKIIDKIFVWRR